jgi:hypothetical protein
VAYDYNFNWPYADWVVSEVRKQCSSAMVTAVRYNSACEELTIKAIRDAMVEKRLKRAAIEAKCSLLGCGESTKPRVALAIRELCATLNDDSYLLVDIISVTYERGADEAPDDEGESE